MGASADQPEPTSDLDLARRALDELGGEVRTRSRWTWVPSRAGWSLEFELRPSGLDVSGPVPATTGWYALASSLYPLGDLEIFPAKDGGLTETFAHQLPNDPGDSGDPWRSGKVCLVDTVRGHELAAKRDEPSGAYERLVWHVWRTLEWLRRASKGELLADGEPFEMPVFGQFRTTGATLAFHEGAETFEAWQAIGETAGVADLVGLRDDRDHPVMAIKIWRDLRGRELLLPAWGSMVGAGRPAETALWFRFRRALVRPPWRSPQTWGEVCEFTAEQGVDFIARLRDASAAIRDDKPHHVLLGFPVSRIMGRDPDRMAFVGFRLPPLTAVDRKGREAAAYPGFRPKTGAWIADRKLGVLADDAVLPWVRTENWHPDELAARGRFKRGLAARRVALLGAGAFGSMLGDLLVRAGVHDLAVFDAGRLAAGNLARHALATTDIDANKATALADRLNAVSPNARVLGFDQAFPPSGGAKAALDAADLVIDATASESVITALGRYAWTKETTFASVSFSYGAERLYAFVARGETFPSADFSAAIKPWLKGDERSDQDFPHEGTGCWSSVFPARADQVALVASIAAGEIDRRCGDRLEDGLVVHARREDGTVTILAEPPHS